MTTFGDIRSLVASKKETELIKSLTTYEDSVPKNYIVKYIKDHWHYVPITSWISQDKTLTWHCRTALQACVYKGESISACLKIGDQDIHILHTDQQELLLQKAILPLRRQVAKTCWTPYFDHDPIMASILDRPLHDTEAWLDQRIDTEVLNRSRSLAKAFVLRTHSPKPSSLSMKALHAVLTDDIEHAACFIVQALSSCQNPISSYEDYTHAWTEASKYVHTTIDQSLLKAMTWIST